MYDIQMLNMWVKLFWNPCRTTETSLSCQVIHLDVVHKAWGDIISSWRIKFSLMHHFKNHRRSPLREFQNTTNLSMVLDLLHWDEFIRTIEHPRSFQTSFPKHGFTHHLPHSSVFRPHNQPSLSSLSSIPHHASSQYFFTLQHHLSKKWTMSSCRVVIPSSL